jgi:hypothetical protein
VLIEGGVAMTVILVTVGGVAVVERAMVAVPNFVESCVEVALMVSEPEEGAVEGAV